ncbi:transglycosylase [Acidithiobacillus marinus]|uniref:Transglycosylase n=1 Tax=Acidithiobacillus marinus TaxID=187490 RepID=A0A2I1DPM1_9PROT|nr:transglycosylase SLT domain-containing protein [Acidithiobacillus marinus]PKY11821.1 transglycosylase [Acidithiobacillus marinus]
MIKPLKKGLVGGLSYAALGLAILAGCHATLAQEKSQAEAAKQAAQLVRATRIKRITRLAGPYARQVVLSARQFHVRPLLVASVLYVENGGDYTGSASRISSAGAIGPMQLMPLTAQVLSVNPDDVRQNIRGGTLFLHRMLDRFHGNVRLALLAYNEGPTAVASGNICPQAETYARRVARWIRSGTDWDLAPQGHWKCPHVPGRAQRPSGRDPARRA